MHVRLKLITEGSEKMTRKSPEDQYNTVLKGHGEIKVSEIQTWRRIEARRKQANPQNRREMKVCVCFVCFFTDVAHRDCCQGASLNADAQTTSTSRSLETH